MGWAKEFKDWIMKGNLIEIAVGLIIALAFAALVTSFVEDIVTPIIGAIGGKPDFSALTFSINDSRFRYGSFINAIITFLIIGLVMFLVIKAATRLMKAKDADTRPCDFCKTDVPLDASRCPACTSELARVV